MVDEKSRIATAARDLAELELRPESSPPILSSSGSHPAIERLLSHEEDALALAPGLHVGFVQRITDRIALVSIDGTSRHATLGEHIDTDFLETALKNGEPALLQKRPSGELIVLGVVQGKHPAKLQGDRVEVVAASEVVVKSGKSALRLREDGVIDLVGARISASSRGLLRLVGRALRLN